MSTEQKGGDTKGNLSFQAEQKPIIASFFGEFKKGPNKGCKVYEFQHNGESFVLTKKQIVEYNLNNGGPVVQVVEDTLNEYTLPGGQVVTMDEDELANMENLQERIGELGTEYPAELYEVAISEIYNEMFEKEDEK